MSESRKDDVVLWLVISFCLIVPVILASLWAWAGRFYPPMLLSILLGIAIAALTYRYLGGTESSQFSIGVLKLAGSAALLLGTTYLTNEGLTSQMDSENSAQRLIEANRALRSRNAENQTLGSQLTSALQSITILQNKSSVETFSIIESTKAGSILGRQLLEMAKKRQGPFSAIKDVLSVKATAIDTLKDADSFTACENQGLAGESVRISREIGASVETVSARQTGTIESVVCGSPSRRFDMQLSCAAGKKLFAEEISDCKPDGTVLWRVPNGQRVFSVSVEVLSGA